VLWITEITPIKLTHSNGYTKTVKTYRSFKLVKTETTPIIRRSKSCNK
jgi:hypothetical protein